MNLPLKINLFFMIFFTINRVRICVLSVVESHFVRKFTVFIRNESRFMTPLMEHNRLHPLDAQCEN